MKLDHFTHKKSVQRIKFLVTLDIAIYSTVCLFPINETMIKMKICAISFKVDTAFINISFFLFFIFLQHL